MGDWVSLEGLGFPGYEIHEDGMVRNERTQHVLKTSPNSEGIIRVGLMKQASGKQVNASLPRLVARAFVQGRSVQFDTPIQLNGNRFDCSAGNIAWRPRWFAVKFFNQFEDTDDPLFRAKIYDVETLREYSDSREAASANGLLEAAIMNSVVSGEPCFPTWQIFARVTN